MVSRKSLNMRSLKSLKRYIKLFDIYDIVVFGSFLRGKVRPEDIDICFVLKTRTKDIERKMLKEVKERYHFNWVALDELHKNPLWSTLLKEGYSLRFEKKLSDFFDLKSGVIYYYSLRNLSPREKVYFSRSLHGREGSKGMAKEFEGTIMGNNVIFIPIEHSDEFFSFLERHKIRARMKHAFLS